MSKNQRQMTATRSTEDYARIAKQYVDDVLAGKVLACEYVKQACKRQRDDIDEGVDGYHYDADYGARVCKFISALTHIKGQLARNREVIVLEPWQVFLIMTVFSWVDDAGFRRFKTVYTEVPRKNAKSTLSSGVGLYLLSADGEEGAEVYSAATTRDQARIVWQDAKRMAERAPWARTHFDVKTSAHAIYTDKTSSTFRALSRDQGGNLDGLNIHGAIIDELHAHKGREIWDVIETGTGARVQPLVWGITTAGFNRSGICYEQRAYALKVLNGSADDDEYFGIVYTIDEGDDWLDEATWIKANPNWGVSVNPDDIRRKARKAMEMASAQPNFMTKHLNVWMNADSQWMDLVAWDNCGDQSLTLDQFEGQPCWVAIDLASKKDIASVGIIFEHGEDGYAMFTKNYLPEDAAEEGRNSQYHGWSITGRLKLTSGNTTDYAVIEDDVRDLASRFDVQVVAYDPWQANYLATRLMGEGLPMVEYRQTVQNMSEPMKELEALVLSGKLKHDGDPVLAWMMSNVVAHLDAKENIYPRKQFPENKIDGVIALIMALGRAIVATEEEASVYELRGIRSL